MNKLKMIHYVLLFVAVSLGFIPVISAAESAVVAKSGDVEIKVEEVKMLMNALSPQERSALGNDPAVLKQTIRAMLVQKIAYKEALAKQWDKQPSVVAQLDKMKETFITQGYLQSISKPPEGFPSAAELQVEYEANKAALQLPKQYRLAQIFVACPKNADKATTDKARLRVESIQKLIKQSGSDFVAIGKAESPNGGEIGWLAAEQIQPEIRTKATGLVKGAVSEPIQLNDGWHILKCLDIKDAHTATLEEVKDVLVQRLRAARSQSIRQGYLSKLMEQNPVAINELEMGKILSK